MAMDSIFRRALTLAFAWLVLISGSVFAQNAQITGTIIDAQRGAIRNAQIEAVNQKTGTRSIALTNGAGVYSLPSLIPGAYRLTISSNGFETQILNDVSVTVADKATINATLRVGNISQSVTVASGGLQVNTTDAAVSTLIDRQFVENIPLNGRSFQSLLTLVPGSAIVPSSGGVGYSGEVTVNGQRTEANYFTVDGVSANTGAAAASSIIGWGAGYAGSVPQETVLGTTQSIVPIEALQEFRATTSTYSAQYGRTPGGQYEFLTRSGGNELHGNAYDYLRNDVFDANSSINNYNGIAKQRERQNDFGGTLGGPLLIPHIYDGRDRTFFFAAYEGLRLRSPQSAVTDVPSYAVRETAVPAMQPFLNAFPLPSPAGGLREQEEGNGLSIFKAGYSVPSSLDNGSFRLDHQLGDKFRLFARYGYTHSETTGRNLNTLSQIDQQGNLARTLTAGVTSSISARLIDDFRFNYTATTAASQAYIDNFGGATPLDTSNTPILSMPNSNLFFELFYGKNPSYSLTPRTTAQHQINVVDWMGYTVGHHTLRWGGDFRRLSNWEGYPSVYEFPVFYDAESTIAGDPLFSYIFKFSLNRLEPTFNNASLFVQDEWKVTERLNLSFGLRWDLSLPPGASNNALPYALTSGNIESLTLAPQGTPLWHTNYKNFAPRFGLAYAARTKAGYETTFRAGFGIFYDMPYATTLQGYWGTGYMAYSTLQSKPFPATQADYDASPAASPSVPYNSITYGFDPHMKSPYSMQWNAAIEQRLGQNQSLLANYVASAGRQLLINRTYDPTFVGNTNFVPDNGLFMTTNAGTSSYHSLQLRFDRKLTRGLQAFLSYTWSHAIDDATTNFATDELLRASSDYDIRHNFQAALTYTIPGKYGSGLLDVLLARWSLDSRITARSATPLNIISSSGYSAAGVSTTFHPDLVAGQPLYLYGSGYPGGRIVNYDALAVRTDADGNPVEGNSGRNIARGFDAVQLDMALRKEFALTERFHLQFRAEAFNLFNHAVWGDIYNQMSFGKGTFGYAYDMQNTQLGGLNPLFQTGGPRSLQLALKLSF
jgi:hypothetical protein